MPTFTILRRKDAFIDYTTAIKADSPQAAAEFARANADRLSWANVGQSEYDAEAFIALDASGREIPNSECGDF